MNRRGNPCKIERNRAVATMREMGATLDETGRYFGITLQRVQQILKRPKVQDIVNPVLRFIEVPAWASNAGLTEDYEDFAREGGDEFAASRCRQLLREMDPTHA